MKPKLLLLHGALGSKKQFNTIEKELEQHFDIHIINFEGHGGDDSSKDFSIDLFTSNVIDYLNTNSIEKIDVFGYSMGGYVALNVATKIPERIGRIIILGTKFDWNLESAAKEVKMLNPKKIEEKIPQFAEKLKKDHYPQDWKQIMKKTADMMLGMGQGKKIVDEDFKKIEHQVTLGVGNQDNMVSFKESEYIANLLPNSKLIQLEGVKHPIDTISKEKLINYILTN